jgi:hypothetical protein
MHEEAAQFRSYLQLLKSPEAQELQKRIVELIRIAFCLQLSAPDESRCREQEGAWLGNPFWRLLDRNTEKVDSGKEAYDHVLAGEKTHGSCPTHIALSEVCRSVGFTNDEALSSIQLYATRNELVQADLEIRIKKG